MSNDTICGHERATLRWALKAGEWPAFNWADPDLQAKWNAHESVTDPAELAEMMVVEGNRLGLSVAMFDHANCTRYNSDIIVRVDNLHIVVTSRSEVIFADMPQARAILRAWLDLSDGDTDGALRAMGGET